VTVASCGGAQPGSSGQELVFSLSRELGSVRAGLFVANGGEGVHRLTRDAPPEAIGAVWAPRGDRILFNTQAAEDDFWTIRTDGSELQNLGPGSGAAWSPDGSTIALVNWGHTIELLNPSGKHERTLDLGSKVEAELQPSWSPDGRRLVIDFDGRLLIVDSSGKTPTRPIRGLQGASGPIWSPDGKLIAFQRGDDAVWVVRPDGSRARFVTRGVTTGFGWAADGSGLICNVVESPDGDRAAVLFPLAGGAPRRLGPAGSGLVSSGGRATSRFGDVSFSPDARSVVVPADSEGRLFTSRPDGSERRYLTDSRSDDGPAWSPDGSRIAFARASDPASNAVVFTIGADGSGERRITPGLNPQWTADGTRVLVDRAGSFHLVDVGSGTDLGSFKGRDAVFSPDGRSVAFVRDRQDGSTLYIAASDGTNARALLRVGTPDLPFGLLRPVWSNDAESIFIADQSPYSGAAHIRRIAVADGDDEILAHSDEDLFDELALSPSGDELAFGTGPMPPAALEILDLRTKERRRVPTPSASWFTGIAWSPGGDRIAYSLAPDSDEENRNDLYIADADGSHRELVSPPGVPVGGWAWRP
jgi:Tol biopolymer transport system component